jgi:hypothetical protein
MPLEAPPSIPFFLLPMGSYAQVIGRSFFYNKSYVCTAQRAACSHPRASMVGPCLACPTRQQHAPSGPYFLGPLSCCSAALGHRLGPDRLAGSLLPLPANASCSASFARCMCPSRRLLDWIDLQSGAAARTHRDRWLSLPRMCFVRLFSLLQPPISESQSIPVALLGICAVLSPRSRRIRPYDRATTVSGNGWIGRQQRLV